MVAETLRPLRKADGAVAGFGFDHFGIERSDARAEAAIDLLQAR